jgi:hypothetical protein
VSEPLITHSEPNEERKSRKTIKTIANSKYLTSTENIQIEESQDIVEGLLDKDKDYQIKKPFMNAQYLQCVPNPKKEGEIITVQKASMWASEFA